MHYLEIKFCEAINEILLQLFPERSKV